MDKKELNIELIIEECGIKDMPAQDFLTNLSNLSNDYDSQTLSEIYNYLLNNVQDLVILTDVVKYADGNKSKSTLSVLTDLLVKRSFVINEDSDVDDLINFKVLCIKAIANYKDSSCMGAILYCLNNKSENYKVRLACADALGRIGDKYAVEPLLDVVKDEEEKSVYLKESATFALGLLGDTSVIDPLVSIMESKQGLLGKFSFLKEKIVEALGKLNINNAKVHKLLKNSLMDSSPMVRINAIEALMNSEYEDAFELIKTSLKDEDDEVKKNALVALYNLSDRSFLEEVISSSEYSEFLKDEARNLIEDYEEDDEK